MLKKTLKIEMRLGLLFCIGLYPVVYITQEISEQLFRDDLNQLEAIWFQDLNLAVIFFTIYSIILFLYLFLIFYPLNIFIRHKVKKLLASSNLKHIIAIIAVTSPLSFIMLKGLFIVGVMLLGPKPISDFSLINLTEGTFILLMVITTSIAAILSNALSEEGNRA
ncbi:hypothetical protein [Curvivirga aplysinae]|uniref:hypothetical protein n=1 Tax=Curvivirga aplysinae TaxID=2529852 RepID=UPI0012BBC649|nr:hypothetical protein [Curvivirga aplysinae]MTI11332.1 hypothetical protein [Curvivirga aplysinae]